MFEVIYINDSGKPTTSCFETKEALIHEFVSRDFRLSFRWGKEPIDYIPSVFKDVALTRNDCRSEIGGHPIIGWFPYMVSSIDRVPRRTMVFEDRAIIDIRPWLPEFRAEFQQMLQPDEYHFTRSGSKPKFRKPYRRTRGLKQALSATVDFDRDDILETVGHVPNKMRPKRDREFGYANRNFEFSWKRNTKARKNWQRHQPAADMVDMKRVLDEDEMYDTMLFEDLVEWVS